ncbi:MAG: PTS glucitol/sorbitol transporter subunit IIA [Firmicutes bacterium]|nr:PTS glucitol/sorbitol transporter subunit IIA [Bacillota bacterium]
MVSLYESRIERVGPLVGDLFERGDLVVLFASCAPTELWDISVLHGHPGYDGGLEPGDVLGIAGQEYTVVAVGDVALKNFRELGHLVLKFSDSVRVELPGQVNVVPRSLPVLNPGDLITVRHSCYSGGPVGPRGVSAEDVSEATGTRE